MNFLPHPEEMSRDSLTPAPRNPTQVAQAEVIEQTPVVLWDDSDPRSVVNLVPAKVRERMQEALFEEGALFEMSEHELFRALKERSTTGLSYTPNPTDNRLRLKFWMEYDYCQAYQLSRIDISRVIAGICTQEYFYKKYLQSPTKVAWFLCPPVNYETKAREALEFSLEQMRDILAIPHITDGGRVDTKLGELKAKIHAMLDIRVKGAPIQKSVVANLTGKAAAQAVAAAGVGETMADIQKKLEAARKRELELTNGGAITIEAQKV